MRYIPKETQIFQRHLTRPILPNTAPRVRADKLDRIASDAGNPDLIGGAGEEGCECRAEGDLVPAGQAGADAD